MDDKKDYDTLVISGGGIKGFFLLGALESLKDNKKLDNIKNYIGTSVGGIIAYLLCIGYSPIEILTEIYKNKWLENMQFCNITSALNGCGTISFSFIQEALEKLTIDKIGKFLTLKRLEEILKKKLILTTYNISKSIPEYLSSENYPDLPCLTAIRMSCNIPLIFDKFKYDNCYYIDGGIVDNFSILKGEEIGEKVIGVYLEINEKSLKDNSKDGVITYISKILQIPMVYLTLKKIELSTKKSTIISINSGDLKFLFDFNISMNDKLEMFSEGYNQCKKS
jgi:predicted acylesterase/phospholipase RssA